MTGPAQYLPLVAMAGFWASSFVLGRAFGDDVEPFSLAFMRFACATAFMTAYALRRRTPFVPTRRRLLGLFVLGFTGVFAYNALFFFGLQTVPATRAALIIAINPAITAAIAALLLGEALRPLQAAGVLVCFVGASTVIADGDFSALLGGEIGPGELALTGGVVSWVTYTLVGKKMLDHVEPLSVIWLSTAAGTVMLAFPAFMLEDFAGTAAGLAADIWAGAAFMGIFASGVAAVWYYDGIRRIGAARTANFIYLVPLFAALLEFAFLGERLTLPVAAGGAAVIVGVWLVQGRRKPPAASRMS